MTLTCGLDFSTVTKDIRVSYSFRSLRRYRPGIVMRVLNLAAFQCSLEAGNENDLDEYRLELDGA
jgi:hypothetical protein